MDFDIETVSDVLSLLFKLDDSRIEDFGVTLSVGVSLFPKDGTDYEELFRKADKCLYLVPLLIIFTVLFALYFSSQTRQLNYAHSGTRSGKVFTSTKQGTSNAMLKSPAILIDLIRDIKKENNPFHENGQPKDADFSGWNSERNSYHAV